MLEKLATPKASLWVSGALVLISRVSLQNLATLLGMLIAVLTFWVMYWRVKQERKDRLDAEKNEQAFRKNLLDIQRDQLAAGLTIRNAERTHRQARGEPEL